jgi:hypothetical protein
MSFRQAIDQTPDLRGSCQKGLQALREIDRNRIGTADPRRLKGSVDVESRLQALYPGERQWDYAVGFSPSGSRGEVIFWIEVHPANDGEVSVVLEKLQFLQDWLRTSGQSLSSLPWVFIWISSGKTSFTLTAPHRKRFALQGLEHVGRFFKIPEKFVT